MKKGNIINLSIGNNIVLYLLYQEKRMSRKRKSLPSEIDKDEIIKKLSRQVEELKNERKEDIARAANAEARAAKAELMTRRLQFIPNIDNNSITSRDSLMSAIEAAKFEDKVDELREKIPNTGDYANDDRSSTTRGGGIQMSRFKRSQVAGTKDQMNVKSTKLPLYDIAKRYLSKKGLRIKKILAEEIEIIKKIRVALAWIHMDSSTKLGEKPVQKIFTLYCQGLLQKISDYGMYGVNSTDLAANIETFDSRNKLCQSRLSGQADVVIGKKFKDDENMELIKKILEDTSIIGELKSSFGSLYYCKSGIGESTDQLLAEMLAISKMRKSEVGRNFVKGVLSDCFFIRMAFRYHDNFGKTFYAISSLYETPKDFVLSIIVLISDITIADICKFQDSAIIVDEYEEDNANCDENDGDTGKPPRVNLFSSKNTRAGKSNNAANKQKINNSKNYGSKRQPLKTMNSNIILIGEDPREEERQADLKNLAEWEACRLGRTYLNSENLKLLG